MAFWEIMTIRQMGSLMINWEEPQVNQAWTDIKELVSNGDTDRWRQRERPNSFELDNRAKTPGLYLFTFVAAVCERAQGEVQGLDALNQRYHLARLLDEEDSNYGWRYALQRIIPQRDFPNEADRVARCWQRIGDYLDAWTDMSPDVCLAELFARVEAANRSANLYNPATGDTSQENLIRDGLNSFRDSLADWSDTLQQLCPQYGHSLDPAPINETVRAICKLIQGGVRQIILTGAPGTGKTYTAGLAAQLLGTPLPQYEGENRPYPLVQFHPSYDYTDFVEGLRPVQVERPARAEGDAPAAESGDGFRFVRLDGTFKEFCRQVAEEGDANQLYFFLIDEINRADLSKVFGELMFCLESDKRGEGRKVQTQYRNLPAYQIDRETGRARLCREDVFAKGFFIPKNVVILGTMNDIDRSVESMDFALRRRFAWREVRVTEELLTDAFSSENFVPALREHAGEAARRVMALNRVIAPEEEDQEAPGGVRFGLNRQYYIAQGQFTGLPEELQDLDELLRFVWDFRLESLLREYVRGEDDREVREFLRGCRAAFLPERD